MSIATGQFRCPFCEVESPTPSCIREGYTGFICPHCDAQCLSDPRVTVDSEALEFMMVDLFIVVGLLRQSFVVRRCGSRVLATARGPDGRFHASGASAREAIDGLFKKMRPQLDAVAAKLPDPPAH